VTSASLARPAPRAAVHRATDAVLVTDGEQRAALAIVRSLGRAGYRVFVCSTRARSLAGASRHCAGSAAVPDPLRDPTAFVRAVESLATRWGAETLLPVSEPSLLALLPERERLDLHIPFPDDATFRRVCDKAAVAEAAARVGIRVPAQHVLHAPGEMDESALRFPLVVKPSRSVVGGAGERSKAAVVHADGAAALRAALRSLPDAAYPLLLQERVMGDGVGVFLLMRDGRAEAAFAHRRLREKPPSGGVSVYRESVALDPDLLRRSEALLREFAWEGVAMVEYKEDASGTPCIMEINGRFWGSLQLAIDAGVDFPALLLAGGTVPAPYRVGVRSRWEWGEVDHLLLRLRRGARELSLPPGAPSRARAAADFLAALGPGSRAEIFRLDDPLPFLRESLDWLRRR
jgi:predicted ATP-grasp superfamily ATP-dependent carboligase